MQTNVVNIKRDKCDIYIGRPSDFGNPFSIGLHGNRQQVIEQFKEYFYEKISNNERFKNLILNLKGKTLGCYCSPLPCHGDIIIEWINNHGQNLQDLSPK